MEEEEKTRYFIQKEYTIPLEIKLEVNPQDKKETTNELGDYDLAQYEDD